MSGRISSRGLTHWAETNGRHLGDDIFKCIFMNENMWISKGIIRFDLCHDIDLQYSRSNMELAISQLKMVWLPWNEKQTYQLKCRPQMGLWPWKWRCEDLKTVTRVTSDVGVPSTGLVILYNQVLANIVAADSIYCTIYFIKGIPFKVNTHKI